jgi:hypothetical protein
VQLAKYKLYFIIQIIANKNNLPNKNFYNPLPENTDLNLYLIAGNDLNTSSQLNVFSAFSKT